jgi:hypothetical protein
MIAFEILVGVAAGGAFLLAGLWFLARAERRAALGRADRLVGRAWEQAEVESPTARAARLARLAAERDGEWKANGWDR